MMTDEKLYFPNQRTEEVQHIIDRMPTRFGFWVSAIVAFLFVLMFVFGWVVRYPDVVNGQISINANSAPLKLIANSNGKLKLNGVKSMDEVKEGQILAYVENPTNPTSVIYIDSLLKLFNPNTDDILNIRHKLPHNFSLGELNSKYYAFSNSLQEFINYKQDKLLDKQVQNYVTLLNEQRNGISTASKRVEMAKNSLIYVHKFYSRDSALFAKKVISESELDKTQMSYLSSKDGLQNAINNLINTKQAAQQTESKIQELGIQKPEKEKELQIALTSAYNDLVDNIKSWEQKYVFKAPFSGKVQFLKFYNENQFVQAGEQVFTIVPKEEKAFGQVILPAQGSGKIKTGQEVIVKLDNYPYMEYGSITGQIKSISLTTNTTKTEKADVETYMVLVDFPNQLKTNYGTKLDFKAEAKGTAEIITNDRRLIQRLFDNLKYILKK
ncbi:HlyD family secretion protein [Pedobacter nototheniae]|uniref:HlyD family secretion protein n=1 Tax=Pedobacter nototheniae TaxID=2488994 RepID=UPI00292EC27D|nr:HlyD family efflux transporter periplasmic adaptor subunit [Pedobacter nototheniae]